MMPRRRDKPNRNAWRNAAICAGVIWLGMIFVCLKVGSDIGFRIGYTLMQCITTMALTGYWARKSQDRWGWIRYAFTTIGIWVVVVVITFLGRAR